MKVTTTGKVLLVWDMFLLVMITIFSFQWINGSTASAKLGGQFYAILTTVGLLLTLIVLYADKKWKWW